MMRTTFIQRHGLIRYRGSRFPYSRDYPCEISNCEASAQLSRYLRNAAISYCLVNGWAKSLQCDDEFDTEIITSTGIAIPRQDFTNRLTRLREVAESRKPVVEWTRDNIFDHCHSHGWIRGLICRSCNQIMNEVDHGGMSYRTILGDSFSPTIIPKEAYARYYHNCPEC